MNVKILGVLGLIAILVATWFFYSEETEVKPALPSAPTASYEVSNITAVQTNPETGATEYTVNAESLVKNANGQDELRNATIDWQPPAGESYRLSAERATLDQATGELRLINGFKLVRKATSDKPEMVIQGNNLSGNTKTRLLNSDEPLVVTQGTDSFKAKGFESDLVSGEYVFKQIEVLFNPPKRQDKALF